MEEPLDPGIPSRLGHKRAGRAREGNAAAAAAAATAAATAVELPWRLRPELCRKGQGDRRRGSGCFPCPPVACRCAGELDPMLAPQLGGPVTPARRDEEPGAEPLPPTGSQQPVGKDSAPLPSAEPGGTGLKFGLLAPELHSRLLDQEDYRNRMQAVEELKRVVEDASQAAVTSVPAPSVLGFISLLCTLLGDFNFKVVLGALEVIYLLALRLDNRVKAFVTPLFSAAAKVLGDSKLAIRQGYRRLLRWLMKAVGPQQVLDLLLQQEYRQNKNSRVREEVINMCIVALLTYPSEELDLAKLAFQLAPALVDNKHRVRHAAMEAFAVLASAMGPGKTALLFKAVDAVELKDNGDGLMRAVQARLARKILPKLADQGFVEYAVPLPSSYHNRATCLPPGADTDWLLMCDRTRSAHSYCGCVARVDALQHSSSHGADANQVACSRKILNAYKGENKLPWENKHAEYKEVGSGVKMPVTQGVEQMKNSLRSLRNTAAKKRAVLRSNISGLESPESALQLDLSGGSPSHVSCPSVDAHSKSGVYSQGCLTSPMPTVLHRRRRMADNFLLLGRKSQTARTFSARNRDPNVAEHNTSTACPAFGDNVRTVGQCFSCGNGCGDYADKKQELSRTAFQSQNTEHQRNYKHSKDEISLSAQGNCKGKRPSGTGAMDKSELGPFSKPEMAVTEALTLLADDHWEKKIEGLNVVRCLSAYHATTLTAKLHETSMAVAQEVILYHQSISLTVWVYVLYSSQIS